jgi:cell wall-associated NlpC family hydrolase
MKKLIAISAMALVMASCFSAPTRAEARTGSLILEPSHTKNTNWLVEKVNEQRLLEEQAAYHELLVSNKEEVQTAVNKARQYVGKTWYVFAGSTPQGWDCSGLVKWTYEKIGIELHHSATAQMNSGEFVDEPKFGDIVAFKYLGHKSAYHVGIYLSPDKMLHSGGKRGDVTEVRSISKFAGDYSEVTYTRVVETK